jgi:hypothetical protein
MQSSPDKPRGIENHSKPKSVSTPRAKTDHTRHPTGRAALSELRRRARRPSSCNHCSGQKSGKRANPRIPPTFADSSQSRLTRTLTRGSIGIKLETIFANHRLRRATVPYRHLHASQSPRDKLTVQVPDQRLHGIQPQGRSTQETLGYRIGIRQSPVAPKAALGVSQVSGRCTHSRALASKPSSSIECCSPSPCSPSIRRLILGTWPLFWARIRAWCAGMEATLSTPPQAAASLAARLFIAANAIHAGNGSSLISRLAFAWRRAPGMQVNTCVQQNIACQSHGCGCAFVHRDH